MYIGRDFKQEKALTNVRLILYEIIFLVVFDVLFIFSALPKSIMYFWIN